MEPKIKQVALTAIMESRSLSSEQKIAAVLDTAWLNEDKITYMATALMREFLHLSSVAKASLPFALAMLDATDAAAGHVEASGEQMVALGNAKKALPERLFNLLADIAKPVNAGMIWQSPARRTLAALKNDLPREARQGIRWDALLAFLADVSSARTTGEIAAAKARLHPAPWRGILYTERPASEVLAEYNAEVAAGGTSISLIEWLMRNDGAAGCAGVVDWQASAASLLAEAAAE